MKILLVSESYPPEISGISSVASKIADIIKKYGFELSIISSAGLITGAYQNTFAKKIFNGSAIRKYKNREYFEGLIGGINPDLIIVLCAQYWGFDFIFSESRKVPVIFYSHGLSWLKNKPRNPLKRILVNKYLAELPSKLTCANIIVLDENLDDAQYFMQHNLSFDVLPNFADKLFENVDGKCTDFVKQGTYMTSTVSNMSVHKNQSAIFDALLRSSISIEHHFIYSSENSYSQKIKRNWYKVAKKYPHIVLHFHCGISQVKQAQIVKSCDFSIFWSKIEAQPQVILESIVSGVPFISSDVGCVKNLPGGVVYDLSNDLSVVLIDVLTNTSLRIKLLNQIIQRRSDYTQKVFSYNFLEILSRCT